MPIIVVISDLQVPLHDRRAVAAVASFVADRGLRTACVGDVCDQWQVSRWCRGYSSEHDGKLAKARDKATEVLRDLRVEHLSRSNHDERIETYVAKHAPALSSLPELTIEAFLRLDELGITFHRRPYKIAPGWSLVHGDEGSAILSPGGTALNIAKRFNRSVVCGHTHKLGIQHDHHYVSGRLQRAIFGFEVGHLMDMSRADYLSAGYANWQQGFGVLEVDGRDVFPRPVFIRNGRFTYDGRTYTG